MAKQRTLEDFRNSMKKHSNSYSYKEVAVRFPYAYHEGFRAFETVSKSGLKVYFCFNDQDVFIQSIVLEVAGKVIRQ